MILRVTLRLIHTKYCNRLMCRMGCYNLKLNQFPFQNQIAKHFSGENPAALPYLATATRCTECNGTRERIGQAVASRRREQGMPKIGIVKVSWTLSCKFVSFGFSCVFRKQPLVMVSCSTAIKPELANHTR